MNLHHLELFYYVARHRGLSEAARQMPYCIQPPAISSQPRQLEEDLGAVLFQRRPFALTPTGVELFAFVEPFFGRLPELDDRLRGRAARPLRIGASEIVLRDHLPAILAGLRRTQPALRVDLRQGYLAELERALRAGELDVAVTLCDETAGEGLRTEPMLEVPLVLLAPRNSRSRTADEVLGRDRIAEPLLALPAEEPISRRFQQRLAERGLEWAAGMEVPSLTLIEAYVANGYGLGLSVAAPGATPSAGVRALPLPDFPRLTLGVLSPARRTPLVEDFSRAVAARAAGLRGA
ncbi:MAG TPA: LysR family transcriptional regulator [Verrucomicrobiota bacterium]|nr:LysR family transcriptional regulator [Verrucomicrobiota bacterium]